MSEPVSPSLGEHVTDCPPLPGSATWVAALGVLGELALIADRGLRGGEAAAAVFSMALTALVVAWVSYGVLAGRPVRRLLALFVLAVSAIGYAVDAAGGSGGYRWPLLHLVLTLAMLGALVALTRSPFHAWQRAHHDTSRAAVGGVMLLAVVSGLLGPLPDQGVRHQHPPTRVSLHERW